MPPLGAAAAGAGLLVHSARPLNAEPPADRLRAAYVTPCEAFYVRCHGDVPRLDGARHRLRVGGRVATPLDLPAAGLRGRFRPRTVVAVMQCAGNRRAELGAVRPVSGDPWQGGAIGNAEWTGVSLADVLRAAGAEEDAGLHVAFAAADECDTDAGRVRFGASIPMAKALSPEVLLADAMNGQPLPVEHGFPLRAVVPGYAGVRSPKWLAAIEVRDRPADGPFQQKDYRLFPPGVTEVPDDPEAGVVINDMPLNAAICEPAAGAALPAGPVAVRGYAVATGRAVVRVDLSADGGANWQQATLERRAEAPWSWTFWEATLALPPGEHEIAVRAWDSAGQTQPARAEDVWNVKGYLCAAWHRVPVRVA